MSPTHFITRFNYYCIKISVGLGTTELLAAKSGFYYAIMSYCLIPTSLLSATVDIKSGTTSLTDPLGLILNVPVTLSGGEYPLMLTNRNEALNIVGAGTTLTVHGHMTVCEIP